MIEVGTDFSGVGAFDQALIRLGIDYKTIFACDMDKYARISYIANYGEPDYFPENVYDRTIPEKSLDIYMTSPPCQAFSLAGKRKGEADKRGVLFYNSHEFIIKNNPRYFIFENVKGLLSDDKGNPKDEIGRTFRRWLDMLGGKSVNGNPVIFPREDAAPYHIYYKVLNAKHFGVPQNRERVFIIGIRDDVDNNFSFPKPFHLELRLKDVLESEVDEKYYLSDKMVKGFINKKTEGFGERFNPTTGEKYAMSVTTCSGSRITDNFIQVSKEVRTAEAKQTRKLTGTNDFRGKEIEFRETNVMNCITSGLTNDHFLKIGAIRGRGDDNDQQLEVNENGTSNALTTVQKDNVVVYGNLKGGKWDKTHEQSGRVYDTNGIGATLHTMGGGNQHPKIIQDYKIRRLTPRECFRLMDFPDSFKIDQVSNTQAYKQAGNSIVVAVLYHLIKGLKLHHY